MRITFLVTCGLPPILAAGQWCTGGFTSLPFGTCQGASQLTCSTGIDSVVWSNGQVGELADGLTPGTYTWQVYIDGEVVQSQTVEILQLAWSITDVHAYWHTSGFTISGWAQVPWCGTSSSQGPCCVPQEDLTYVRLVQDGATEIVPEYCTGCDALPCFGSTIWFSGTPTGHTYSVRLYDLTCGNVVNDTTLIIAHACENLELMTEAVGTPAGAMDGEVHLLEAIPDTTEPYPIHAPVIGEASLHRGLSGYDLISTYAGVSSATWSGLDTGYYRVVFLPDEGCNQVTDTAYVSQPTTIGQDPQATGSLLQIMHTDDPDRIRVQIANGKLSQVEVLDAMGRSVLIRELGNGLYDISATSAGILFVRARSEGTVLTSRFLRR